MDIKNTNQHHADTKTPKIKLTQEIKYNAPTLINLKLEDKAIHGATYSHLNENSHGSCGLFVS